MSLYNYLALAERVVDADTIECRIDLGFNIQYLMHVRLKGVNAPERNTPEGKVMTQQVSEWITKNGREFLLVTDKDKRSFTRYVGTMVALGTGGNLNDYVQSLIDQMWRDSEII